MADFLTIKNLNKDYDGRKALCNLSFTLQKGDFLSLFGPNGAGKSTLLRIIATLISPSSGRVEIKGFDLQEEPELFKVQLGVISHQSLLYEHMTARENLIFYGALYKVEDPEERADELLRIVDLYPRRHSRVGQFSRGMRQRLSIARALVNDPSLLLLDEPFSGLDQYASTILAEQLRNLKNRERTVIMVTHNLDRGLAAATKVGILAGGRLAYLEEGDNIDQMAFEDIYLQYIHGARAA
jgi:heme exporter protein A